ncbi:hypothetical protein D3C77_457610 [compost metagenome]
MPNAVRQAFLQSMIDRLLMSCGQFRWQLINIRVNNNSSVALGIANKLIQHLSEIGQFVILQHMDRPANFIQAVPHKILRLLQPC